jgi:hypothetical protein
MRFTLLGTCLVLIVSGCGDGEMSLTEYVESVNAINGRAMQQYTEMVAANPQGAVIVADRSRLNEFTPHDLHVALERTAEIQAEALEKADALNPPEQIADLHYLFFKSLPLEALAVRAGTAADWDELSDSPEMEAYRDALIADIRVCIDFQARLDATAERGAFANTPWIPTEMKEIVEVVLGCDQYPANPEDLYRPLPTTD